jgi:hypothetical protein
VGEHGPVLDGVSVEMLKTYLGALQARVAEQDRAA